MPESSAPGASDINSVDALYKRPGFLLRRAHQISVSLFMEESAEFNITTTQYGVLVILRCFEDLDQMENLRGAASAARERALSAFSPEEGAEFLRLLEKFVAQFNGVTRAPIVLDEED